MNAKAKWRISRVALEPDTQEQCKRTKQQPNQPRNEVANKHLPAVAVEIFGAELGHSQGVGLD